MSRLMSVAFTEQAVIERRKTVTRRKGWWEDKNGRRLLKPYDRLTLCRKVMGRKPGEPLVRLCEVEVVSVRREPLCAVAGPHTIGPRGEVSYPEMIAEGFPDMDPHEFMRRFFIDAQGIGVMDDVTRIEWRYICRFSERVDGPYHSERFLGDDSYTEYTECVYCGEVRDALTGRLIRAGAR